jgi:cytochrome c-type biogenesis protein CcmE
MTPKARRLRFIALSLALMGFAAFLILRNFQDSLVFFFTPTQWQEKHAAGQENRPVRIGGLVKQGSVRQRKDGISFTITDLSSEIGVAYRGLLPTLFREGQGVVAEGTINDKGEMTATTLLAKHDENYMPKAVVDQLKASGKWREYQNAPRRHPGSE